MIQELSKFDSLKADIIVFVAPVKTLKVSDFKSSADAIETGKAVKKYLNELEKRRKEIVGPLNDQVKLINSYVKDIEIPLIDAEGHLKRELSRFSDEQEKLRMIEMQKAMEARRIAEHEAEKERLRIAAEIEAKRVAEMTVVDQQDEIAALFGTETVDGEAERARIEADTKRAKAEETTRLDMEAAVRKAEHAEKTWAMDQFKIKNTRKTWKCEAVDITQVPKEFLTVTLNEKAVIEAARAGVTEISGVRIWQETSVAFGDKTYVPRAALE